MAVLGFLFFNSLSGMLLAVLWLLFIPKVKSKLEVIENIFKFIIIVVLGMTGLFVLVLAFGIYIAIKEFLKLPWRD